ncbi:MAG: hypothetical protein HW421_1745 [Ignavibacteria bacterium]|nr:hypothetical protein [Ignavibacteria bacterium]
MKPFEIHGYDDVTCQSCNDPAMKLIYHGQPGEFFGHLSIIGSGQNTNNPGGFYTFIPNVSVGDMVLQVAKPNNTTEKPDLILANRSQGKIRFSLQPPTEEFPAPDLERMTIEFKGVGIHQENPTEELHIGRTLTFHSGISPEDDPFIGNGVYSIADNVERRLHPNQPGSILKFYNHLNDNKFGGIDLLLVKPGLETDDVTYTEVGSEGWNGMRIQFNNNNGYDGKAVLGFGTLPDNNSRFTIRGLTDNGTTNSLKINNSAGVNSLIVQDDGNVGIGTTSLLGQKLCVEGNVRIGIAYYTTALPPECNYRLSVDGQVAAKDIIVTYLNWAYPDYVFDKNYKPIGILELEKKIDELGHLPDMPSASEVKDKGLNVGEMQVQLLKKVEELTLYVIELKKQNNELGNRIKQLEKK